MKNIALKGEFSWVNQKNRSVCGFLTKDIET